MTDLSDAGACDLKIETRRAPGAVIVAARGEVTAFTSPQLRKVIREVAGERPARLVMDLSQTTYIDSSGVATLVEGLQVVARYQGKLVLAGMDRRVRGVFEITRLHTIFAMADSVEEALKP